MEGRIEHGRATNDSFVNRSRLFRAACDAIIAVACLFVVMVGRVVYLTTLTPTPEAAGPAVAEFFSTFTAGSILVASITINTFYLSGVYRRMRYYQTRYKIRAIARASTIAQLVFAALVFIIWDFVEFPRSVLVPNWLLTTAVLVLVRVYGVHLDPIDRILDWVDRSDDDDDRAGSGPRSVLVVGGGGYIGSAVVRRLLDRGWNVRLLDLLLFGDQAIKDLLSHPNLELIREDFRQVHHVMRAVAGVDRVIHLGAIVGDPACALDEELTIKTNLMATRMLAEVAKFAGVSRFVFASTCSVYGANDEMLDEMSTLNPVSLYAQSKIACEEVLSEIADESFSPTILRFGTIYGLSDRVRFDLVVNLLTAKAIQDGELTVFGGDQWRPFVHVEDAAEAVMLALESPPEVVRNRTFNVGSNEQNLRIRDVAELIRGIVPSAEVKLMEGDGERRDYRVDFTRIERELGFEPRWTLEMGVRQVIEALETGAIGDYRDPVYSNVAFLADQGIVDLAARDLPVDREPATVVRLDYVMQFPHHAGRWVSDLVGRPGEAPDPPDVGLAD